jgi:predicted NBD/HSP70 family sugar kinase
VDHSVTVLELLRNRPRSSRAELADAAGLSQATISRVLGRLRRDGFVEEIPTDVASLGRPPGLVRIRPGAAHVVGIDAGGQHVRGVAVDLGGTARRSEATEIRGSDDGEVLGAVTGLVRRLSAALEGSRLLAVAVGVSGIVDDATGIVRLSPDLPALDGLPLGDRLHDALDVPVAVENDDLLAAVGEAALGAARGCTEVAFLSLGYGLGAGLIVRGRPVRGASGSAGAIAYLAPGRLEDRASGRSIPSRYRDLEGGTAAGATDAAAVFARAAEGDPAARQAVEEVFDALGAAVVNVAALLDPQVIVLGGGLTKNGPLMLERLVARLAESVPYPPRLVASELGDAAVSEGAALIAFSLAKRTLGARHGVSAVQPEPAKVGALELI